MNQFSTELAIYHFTYFQKIPIAYTYIHVYYELLNIFTIYRGNVANIGLYCLIDQRSTISLFLKVSVSLSQYYCL